MSSGSGRFLRENAFLVAAVSLPLVIVALFLLLAAIPRWTVPPPGYDVLVRTTSYDQAGAAGTAIDFVVQDERLHVTVREAPANSWPPRSHLWLVEHQTLDAKQIPIEIPRLSPGEGERTFPLQGLEGKRVLAHAKAPDGYEFQNRSRGGGGLLGGIFGMDGYSSNVALVKGGRVIKLSVPEQYRYQPPQFVGWVVSQGTH